MEALSQIDNPATQSINAPQIDNQQKKNFLSKKTILLISAIVSALVISVSAYAFLLAKQQATTTPKANWQTYRSPSGEFATQFPSNWKYRELLRESGSGEEVVAFGPTGQDSLVSITAKQRGSLDQEVEFVLMAHAGRIVSNTEVVVDGIKGRKIVSRHPGINKTYAGGQYSEQHDIVLFTNSKSYTLKGQVIDTEKPETKHVATILSSFTFLKKDNSGEIAQQDSLKDWITYRNTKIGYKVQHPKDWKVEEQIVSEKLQPMRSRNTVVFNIAPSGRFTIAIPKEIDVVSYLANMSDNCAPNFTPERIQLSSGKTVQFTDRCFSGLVYIYFVTDGAKQKLAVVYTHPITKDNPTIDKFLSTFTFTE